MTGSKLLLADDTPLVEYNRVKCHDLNIEFSKLCEDRNLKVNTTKRTLMRCSRDSDLGQWFPTL